MSIFSLRDIDHNKAKIFFDESGTVDIQRYETSKYPIFKKLLDQQLSFFWRPEEINLSKDAADFKDLTEAEQHVFTSNLKRQILLDSIQGRGPSLCFGRVVSDPIVETLIHTWNFFENIHSLSYTHIIRNVYPDPSKIFDEMRDIEEIVRCGEDVSQYYDSMIEKLDDRYYSSFSKKYSTYMALVATNALEQIRFQVSFACTFSFGQRNLMSGSSRIVKLIRQDEALHCGITQNLLKVIVKEDEEFAKIAEDFKDAVSDIYHDVYKQELEWIEFLFQKGPIFGLTKEELELYLSWLTAKRMQGMGITPNFKFPKKDPLPWMARWIDTEGDQPPPQEEEIVSYQTGTIDFNINESEFEDIEL